MKPVASLSFAYGKVLIVIAVGFGLDGRFAQEPTAKGVLRNAANGGQHHGAFEIALIERSYP